MINIAPISTSHYRRRIWRRSLSRASSAARARNDPHCARRQSAEQRRARPQQRSRRRSAALEEAGVRVAKRSRWYRSAPVPASDQPDYVNGVVARRHSARSEGAARAPAPDRGALRPRARRAKTPRARSTSISSLTTTSCRRWRRRAVLPHPRLHERAFVLLPARRDRARLAPSDPWPHRARARKEFTAGRRRHPFLSIPTPARENKIGR